MNPRALCQYRGTDNTEWSLEGEPLASGGEGAIFAVKNHPTLVAKVYHAPRPETAAKLRVMIARSPVQENTETEPEIVWPQRLLVSPNTGEFRGFLMRRLQENRMALTRAINPGLRKQHFGHFSFRHLLIVASNLALIVDRLHALGHVIGDLNDRNFLVGPTGRVALVDTDSIQVREGQTTLPLRRRHRGVHSAGTARLLVCRHRPWAGTRPFRLGGSAVSVVDGEEGIPCTLAWAMKSRVCLSTGGVDCPKATDWRYAPGLARRCRKRSCRQKRHRLFERCFVAGQSRSQGAAPGKGVAQGTSGIPAKK